ncbi:MAG: hypothetical protein GX556_16025 [Fibrobacter sp.]|nr:hypothetical protein [Fibrobacter sp.]
MRKEAFPGKAVEKIGIVLPADKYRSKLRKLMYLTDESTQSAAMATAVNMAIHQLQDMPEETRPGFVNGFRDK